MIRLLTIFALLIVTLPTQAMDALQAMHSISAIEHHTLTSRLLERDLQIIVRLPDNHQPGSLYPTVYLLDGGALFPMLAGYYHYLRFEEVVPDLIIVGISYGSGSFEGGNYRSTDYTAPSKERAYWGGASKFQQALKQEILPLIETSYPANPDDRILFGQSLAGQFVLFSAFSNPGLFAGHIASNPALHRNLDYFINLPVNQKAGTTKLFVVSGSEDFPEYAMPRNNWISHQMKTKPAIDLEIETIEGYGHFSLAPEAFRQGLAHIIKTREED
jgi:predicted alpha/beta superfamily hydrolase